MSFPALRINFLVRGMMLILGFFQSDSSSTAIEYALIGAFIFLVIIAGVTAIGKQVISIFNEIAPKV